MFTRPRLAGSLLFPIGLSALLAGCAATPTGSTVQVMPGPGKSFATFQSDNATCKSVAAQSVQGQAEAANQQAVGTGLLTTVLATGLGAATGAVLGDAGGGAAIGAAAGAGGGTLIGANGGANAQATIQQSYDIAFSQCMYSRGEQVPGYAPVVAMAGAGGPDPTVRATQVELIRLGYLHDSADGYAGGHTRSAISSFEQANGLPVDGAASSTLLARLQSTSGGATTSAAWVQPTGGSSPPRTTTASAPAAGSSGWVQPSGSGAPAASGASTWVTPQK